MKSLVVIQARMGSSRLPGKSFIKIGDFPMLDYLVESVLTVFPKCDVILATSEKPENDVLRNYALEKGIACFSGDENDVASRYLEILQKNKEYDYFFRICGDTPYYDTEILREGLRIIDEKGPDIISSMPNKGYPMGCNLEVFSTAVFLHCYTDIKSQTDKEHVTSYFYREINKFDHVLVSCNVNGYRYDKYKFSVDTYEDLELAKRMLSDMKYAPWKYSLNEKMDLQTKLNSYK